MLKDPDRLWQEQILKPINWNIKYRRKTKITIVYVF